MFLRPEVAAFAQEMERRLRANDHKAHWGDATAWYLFNRLKEEVTELMIALTDFLYEGGDFVGTPRINYDNVLHEAADVANFAMMIADVAGTLPNAPEGTEG